MIKTPKKTLLIGLSTLMALAVAAYATTKVREPSAVKEVVSEGSGPDARLAADLLRPDAPARGPLNTDELKHITLHDQDGKAFSLADLKGETILINFMFAGCTSVCPVQTIGLRRVHNEMQLDPKKDRIKLLSISIAPLSDTPEQLKSFAKRFEIDTPNWRFAVASQSGTDELSKQFSVGVKPLEGDQLDHRSLLYLINPEGVMIQQYRGSQVDVERLKKELRIVDELSRQAS